MNKKNMSIIILVLFMMISVTTAYASDNEINKETQEDGFTEIVVEQSEFDRVDQDDIYEPNIPYEPNPNYVKFTNNTWSNEAYIQFNASYVVKARDGYNLKSGKVVRQAYVRLKEGKKKDTGRVYTKRAPYKIDKKYSKSIKISDWFGKARGYYGWLYF